VVRAGDWLAVSGQLGTVDGALVNGGVAAEVHQALANMAALLESEGATLSSVVKTTVFLRHMSDYGPMNEAYVESFGDHRPARAAVAVSDLPLSAKVEIDAWAYSPQERPR
jgi:2-iminobutanoate/2-iminopropanoate deaminase